MSIFSVRVVSCLRNCSMVGESTNLTVFVRPPRDCFLWFFPQKCAASRSKTESPTESMLMLVPEVNSRAKAFFFQSAGSPLGHEAAKEAWAETTETL